MISAGVADAAAAYEQLRHHVLTGSAGAGHVGVIVLMRAGIAAWLDHAAAGVPSVARAPVAEGPSPAWLPPLQAGLVAVLADLVWTTREERHP